MATLAAATVPLDILLPFNDVKLEPSPENFVALNVLVLGLKVKVLSISRSCCPVVFAAFATNGIRLVSAVVSFTVTFILVAVSAFPVIAPSKDPTNLSAVTWPLTPTPPVTIKAPVVLVVEAVLFWTVTTPSSEIVTGVLVPAVTVPVKVGEIENTNNPLPVSSVIAFFKLAEFGVPKKVATPVPNEVIPVPPWATPNVPLDILFAFNDVKLAPPPEKFNALKVAFVASNVKLLFVCGVW